MTASSSARERSDAFLKISDQFQLGALVTESPHPVTANLSDVASRDIAAALDLLFQVDADVVRAYERFVHSGRAADIAAVVLQALQQGGRIFFTGCGATGRLSIQLVSIWRDFWQTQKRERPSFAGLAEQMEPRALSVMAGGDFALIKSVEGFEDYTAFGRKQLADLNVSSRDVVFAITEGGETSFVIGTAWQAVEAGAKVCFVYNNPDAILCEQVQRSREVIQDARIEKLNLTTGPMAITGSTRMQATSVQLCVMLTVLEMVARELVGNARGVAGIPGPAVVPGEFLDALKRLHHSLRSPEVLAQLAQWVQLEENVYRSGGKNNYFADRFAIDVLTDTTERSPTFCTPSFKKFDDTAAAVSWSFLYVGEQTTAKAWAHLLKRDPACVEWSDEEVRRLVEPAEAERVGRITRRIGTAELMRFRIGLDGLPDRPLSPGDSAIAIGCESELSSDPTHNFFNTQLRSAKLGGAGTAFICFGFTDEQKASGATEETLPESIDFVVRVRVPRTGFLLDGITRVAVKVVLNAVSTCTMVRLGRVMGNYMVWVVASNLKLIDRATRYVQQLANLSYDAANRLLFEVIEYVEPRMKLDQAYPPVVALAVLRAKNGLSNEEAEEALTDTR